MEPKEIELSLLPRLRFIGILLLAFSLAAIIYDFLPNDIEEEEIALSKELLSEDPPPLSPYLVATAFALVGASCIFISWKKLSKTKE